MQGHGGRIMLSLCQYLQLGILCNTRDNRLHTAKNEIAQACMSIRVVNMTKTKPDLQTGNLSNQQRLAIIHYKDKHPDISHKAIAKQAKTSFNLSRTPSESTISRCFSRKTELENLAQQDKSIHRKRVIVSEELGHALALWVQQKEQ